VENDSRLEQTIQLLAQKYNYFDMNSSILKFPLCDQISTLTSLCRCFPANKETQKHVDILDYIYLDPVIFVLKNFKTNFSDKKKYKMSMGKTLTQLEWITFRDGKFKTALNKEYSIDSAKPKMMKSITYDDIVSILGLVKRGIGNIFIDVIVENNINLNPLNLPIINSNNSNLDDLINGGDSRE